MVMTKVTFAFLARLGSKMLQSRLFSLGRLIRVVRCSRTS
jgi:hypothetical protein